MKYSLFTKPCLLAFVMLLALSCRKQSQVDGKTATLQGSRWLLIKEILHFPTGQVFVNTRNSVFTFSANHDLSIDNPDSYLEYETGRWTVAADKINTDMNNSGWQYQRSYKILTRHDTFLRLHVENLAYSALYGNTSEVHYELVKL